MPQDFDSEAMLAFFGQLGKSVDDLKGKIASLNETAGKGTQQVTSEFEKLGQTIVKYTRGPINAMDKAVVGLAKTLTGAGGLALSFAGAAKAMDTFAVGELHLRNFATNTGFTVDNVKNMRVQLAAAGIEAGEAASSIGGIGGKLQEVLALQETSSFYKALQASQPAMAEHVRQLVNAGKQTEALNYLQDKFNNGGERFKAWLPTVTGMSRAAWEAGRRGMEGLIAPWKFNDEEAAKYHKTMTNLETISTGVWTSISYTMLESLNKMIGGESGMKALNKSAEEFAQSFRDFFNTYVMPTLETTRQEFGWVIKGFTAIDDFLTKWTGKSGGDVMGKTVTKILEGMGVHPKGSGPTEGRQQRRQRREENQSAGEGQGWWEWLKKQMSMEVHAGEVEPGSTLLEQREEAETAKDSSQAVKDMRDIMIKWDNQGSGGGAQGGGGMNFRGNVVGGGLGPYGATRGTTFRPGVTGGGRSRGGPDDGGSSGGPPGAEVPGVDPGEGKQGSEYLAARRAALKKEVEGDPELKKQFAAIMMKEHESDPAAVFESFANRYDYINSERAKQGLPPLSAKRLLMGRDPSGRESFYGPIRSGQLAGAVATLERDPKRMERMFKAMDYVFQGSNLIYGATDQGSGSDQNVGHGGGKIVRFGETYNDFGGGPGGHAGAARYREMIMRGFKEGAVASSKIIPGRMTYGGKAWAPLPQELAAWPREAIDDALRAKTNANASAKVDIEFDAYGEPKKKSVWETGAEPFIPVKIHRSPQAPMSGGGVEKFNTYAFE